MSNPNEIPGLDSEIYFGDINSPLPDWRERVEELNEDDEDSPDDEQIDTVIGVLGFDPTEGEKRQNNIEIVTPSRNTAPKKLIHPKIKSHIGYQSKKLSHDADIALQVIKRACGQYNLAPLVAVRRALAVAGFSSRGQQDSLIQELRRAMRVSATGFEGRHGISKEEQDAAIVEGNNRLGFLAMR